MGKGFSRRDSSDGVRTAPANEADLASYANAEQNLSALRVPRLVDTGRDRRFFVVAFDGTGNDMDDDAIPTNVGRIVDGLVEATGRDNRQVRVAYVRGIGTQDNVFARTLDAAVGATYESRIEQMYSDFMRAARTWRRESPQAEISLAGIGFSRGAVQAAGFARLVHERGIQDPDGVRRVWGPDGHTEIVYTRPPLVPPGQVPQVLGLFDPVATGIPALDDVRLPPSVLSAFQISAEDERRDWFPGMDIVPRGLSKDGRFLNVVVGGAHCDIGGGYRLDGLSVRAGNLMADYLNALSDQPLLSKRLVPADPAMNVVHRSEDHLPIYSTLRFRFGGGRTHMPPADGSLFCSVGIACADPEPVDRALAARFDYRPVAIGPEPAAPALATAQPLMSYEAVAEEVRRLFDRLAAGAEQRDAQAMRATGREFLRTAAGAEWRESGRRSPETVEAPVRKADAVERGLAMDLPPALQALRP